MQPFEEELSGLGTQLGDAPAPRVAAPPPAYGRLMAGALAFGAMSLGFGFVLPSLVGAGEHPPALAAPAPVVPPRPAEAPSASASAGTSACPISLPPTWATGFGKALGPVPAEVAEPSVARAEVFVHGKVSPEYQGKPREFVSVHTRRGTVVLYAVIPNGMVIKPGEIVQVAGRHRDMTKPCNYVPFLLTGVVAGKG